MNQDQETEHAGLQQEWQRMLTGMEMMLGHMPSSYAKLLRRHIDQARAINQEFMRGVAALVESDSDG